MSENESHVSHYKQYTQAHKKYQNSEKGKSARSKYQNSEKGKAARKRYQNRRNMRQSLALKVLRKEIDLSEAQIEAQVVAKFPS